jgi:hypothetical protein
VSALLFLGATRSYESDMQRFGAVRVESVSTKAAATGGAVVGEAR